MEKDIGKIKKNDNTDIVIRVDDFGGKIGVTIREFTDDQRTGYKGFTKAGTRITTENFKDFKDMINSISLEGLEPSPEAIQKAQEFKNKKSSFPNGGNFNKSAQGQLKEEEESYL